MNKLSESEKILIETMNELDLHHIGGEIKKILEGYFIKKGWMKTDGSFELNDGGYSCLSYMAKKEMF